MVARGHINVEKITSKPYTVGPANIEMRRLHGPRRTVADFHRHVRRNAANFFARGPHTEPPRFTANVGMRNLDVAKVLEVSPSARGKMGGTGELDLQLLGALSDAWKKTLSGTGKFAIRNGHLPGVNLPAVAQSVGKMGGVGGDTPFSVLEGDIDTKTSTCPANRFIWIQRVAPWICVATSVSMERWIIREWWR